MSIKAKKNLLRIPKLLGVALFALLFFFNIQIMLTDKQSGEADLSLFGVKINLFESAYAENDSGGGGGGGTKHTFFANYGTVTKQVYCQKVEYGTGGITITYYWATEYYIKEVCVYGGNRNECTYATVRLTYQGGGCSF